MPNMASASTLAAASAANSSRNDSSSAKKPEEVDETPKTATRLNRLNRASSSGKDKDDGGANFTTAVENCEEDAASPRYKFDMETRKFVLRKDRSPRF